MLCTWNYLFILHVEKQIEIYIAVYSGTFHVWLSHMLKIYLLTECY